jgi:hypothetical protein
LADEIPMVEPAVEEITIKASLKGKLDDVYDRLSKLPMFEFKREEASLTLANVESRDMQKRPFLFMLIEIKADSIRAQYSIAPDTSEKLRRLGVIKTMFNILSLVSDIYAVDDKELFQYADSSIDNVISSISQNYSILFNKYDSLFNDYRGTKRMNVELVAANRTLTVQAAQLSKENEGLRERLLQLEKYSDEALMAMLEEWMESHDSTIDINEFANLYKLTPTRIEQMLNRMVSLGYIEVKG